jgi:superfamily II DNA helicase RecQ
MASLDSHTPARTPSLDDARALMSHVYGFRDFRPGQDEIIEAVLAG